MWAELEVWLHELLSRIEEVLDGIEAAVLESGLDDGRHGVQERRRAACLDQQSVLVYEQAALAKHIGLEIARARVTQYLAVDQIQELVENIARDVSEIIEIVIGLQLRLGVGRSGEPDFQQLFGALKEIHCYSSVK